MSVSQIEKFSEYTRPLAPSKTCGFVNFADDLSATSIPLELEDRVEIVIEFAMTMLLLTLSKNLPELLDISLNFRPEFHRHYPN
mgnify:CR=1 FL=1